MVKTVDSREEVHCAEELFQATFLLVLLLNTLLAEPEFNALVVVWSGERSTRSMTRLTERDTSQIERILDNTCDHSTPLDSRLFCHEKENSIAHHPCIDSVPSCLLLRLVSDIQSPLLLNPHFVQGLRNFIKVDALEVGHLKEGTRTFLRYEGQKFKERCPGVSVREGREEVTLRAEEFWSLKACINVDHIAEDRWRPPLVDADWHAFCQAIYKGVEGSDWEKCTITKKK